MKKLIVLTGIVLTCQLAFAQLEDRKYIVKSGTRPKDTFTFSDIYLYPSFVSAKVYFKTNKSGSGKMNYDRYTGEMDFIQGKDTLALVDQETIKNVNIGNDVFYYQGEVGYVKRVSQTENATLGKKEYFKLVDKRRNPNSATASSAGANGSYNNLISTGAGIASGLTLKMVEQEDMIYRKATEYYFANAKGFFMKADQKSLLKLFPDKKAALNSYFEGHDVDLNNEESLNELFTLVTQPD